MVSNTAGADSRPTTAGEQARGAPLRRDMPIVPATSIAGTALMTVVAIMTFLASLTAGVAVLIDDASRDWRSSVALEMTIQVRPTPGHDLDSEATKAADVARATPEVREARVFTRQESEAVLQPWLGAGLDLGDLPVPRLVVVRVDAGHHPDLDGLRKALAAKVVGASLDDHRVWLDRLGIMANTVVGGALVIFALVIAAMALAVTFATHGAMAGSHEIVEVLHFVGAEDRFIARQFQRHFLRLGLRGGALGGGVAIAVFWMAGAVSLWMAQTPGGDQLQAMFGTFDLGWSGFTLIVIIAGGIAFLTGTMSRVIVYRHLRGLD